MVLVVCPNVTIRSRLAELDPKLGDASVYRKADLVPPHLMPDLSQGDVVVTNWHVFEPRTSQAGGIGGRVVKAGRRETKLEIIHIGMKTTTARGKRYLTKDEYVRQASLGLIEVIDEARDRDGNVTSARVTRDRYVESDTGHAKSDEAQWMRFTLDTVGRIDWPRDTQGRPIYPEGFEDLAKKCDQTLHPPGRDIRCIVSVGMLTEGCSLWLAPLPNCERRPTSTRISSNRPRRRPRHAWTRRSAEISSGSDGGSNVGQRAWLSARIADFPRNFWSRRRDSNT